MTQIQFKSPRQPFLFNFIGIFFSVFLFSEILCLPAHASPSILITAFEPFGFSNVNLSENVAFELEKKLQHRFQTKICVLPTVYDQAAREALACFHLINERPSIVVSLGEGDCGIRIETQAENLDDTPAPDNAGQMREGSLILKEGPTFIPLSIRPDELLESLTPEDRVFTKISYSAGNFVCNNTAYHLGYLWGNTPSQPQATSQEMPRYTFIHVPHSRCGEGPLNPEKVAQIISKMILGLP